MTDLAKLGQRKTSLVRALVQSGRYRRDVAPPAKRVETINGALADLAAINVDIELEVGVDRAYRFWEGEQLSADKALDAAVDAIRHGDITRAITLLTLTDVLEGMAGLSEDERLANELKTPPPADV